jgi:hypothetical protein
MAQDRTGIVFQPAAQLAFLADIRDIKTMTHFR